MQAPASLAEKPFSKEIAREEVCQQGLGIWEGERGGQKREKPEKGMQLQKPPASLTGEAPRFPSRMSIPPVAWATVTCDWLLKGPQEPDPMGC